MNYARTIKYTEWLVFFGLYLYFADFEVMWLSVLSKWL